MKNTGEAIDFSSCLETASHPSGEGGGEKALVHHTVCPYAVYDPCSAKAGASGDFVLLL